MSNKSSKYLFLAVVAAIKASESVEKAYTLGAAKALAELLEEYEGQDLRNEWKALNIATYQKAGVVKGDTMYNQLAKYASMLLRVSTDREDVLDQYLAGKWISLQGVYNAILGKQKKAAVAQPRSFAERFESFVASATPRQRKWMVANVRSVVKAVTA